MTVGAMSGNVVNHILKKLKDRVQKDIAEGYLNDALAELKPGSILGSEIRTQGNKIQEGIMTQRSLDLLAADFKKAMEENEKGITKRSADKYKGGKGKKDYRVVYNHLTNNTTKTDTSADRLKALGLKVAQYLGTVGTFERFVSYYQQKYFKTSTGTNSTEEFNTEAYEEGKIVRSSDYLKNTLIAKGLTHGEFNKRFIDFVRQDAGELISEFIDANTDAGHFLGVFNLKFASLLDLQVSQTGRGISDITGRLDLDTSSFNENEQGQIDKYADLLTQSMQLMSNADIISSNLLNNLSLASTTTKIIYDKNGMQSSVEVSLSGLNQEAGRQLVSAAKQLKALALQAKNATEIDGGQFKEAHQILFRRQLDELFKSVSSLGDYINKISDNVLNSANEAERELAAAIKANSKVIVDVLKDTSGSDSFNQAISKSIHGAFTNSIPNRQVTISKDSLSLVPKSTKVKLKPPKLKTPSKATISPPKPIKVNIPVLNLSAENSLTGLQALLNATLVERVKQNMGSGNRRDILNLRTGRFAESVKVERLSESRAGMITAFYTYMRNPYGTFSEGGRQQNPRSRDPKLLIAKSIREIAQEKVASRLRAVLV